MENKYKKTILVTGGAGFIGSNYLNKFVPKYKDIFFVNLDALTYAGDLNNVAVSDHDNYSFEKVDIRHKSDLRDIFTKYKVDAIIHFAAESHVDLSIDDSSVFVETNVIGTHNLLDLAEEHKLDRFHFISTDEVYGDLSPTDGPFTEDSPQLPRNPYSASKAAADLLVRSYNLTHGLDTIVTRSSNAYGPNQDLSKLIPSFASKLAEGKKVPLYGKGEQMREWVHVEDFVDAVDVAFNKGKKGGIYNIGTGHEMTNYDLTCKLLKYFGKDESNIEYVEDRKGHDFRYALDISKIRNELGWSPKISFEEGLDNTLGKYKKSES